MTTSDSPLVCPLSVLSNWEKQISDHIADGHLTSYTYHGSGKDVTTTSLQQYDVSLCYREELQSLKEALLGGPHYISNCLCGSLGLFSQSKFCLQEQEDEDQAWAALTSGMEENCSG